MFRFTLLVRGGGGGGSGTSRNLRFSLVVSMDVAQRARGLHHSLQKQILRPVSTCPGGQTLDSTIHRINCYPLGKPLALSAG